MKKKNLFLFLTLCVSIAVFAQTFTNVNAGLEGLHFSDVAWGDYDTDGDLDVVICGLTSDEMNVTKIYRNDGESVFTEIMEQTLIGLSIGDVAWGDYDADGDLDIILQGYMGGNQMTKLYKNNGNDSFADSGIELMALADGSVSFIDFNNDGKLDIFTDGFAIDSSNYGIMYKNEGNGEYTMIDDCLPGSFKAAYEWADYDNDGDMDVFFIGHNGVELASKLYVNNGDETFSDSGNEFFGLWLGDVCWGDYNSDGNLDLLVTGFGMPNNRETLVYKNNGDGSFTALEATGLDGGSHSTALWGDFNNDGDLDVFFCGTDLPEGSSVWDRYMDIYINNGDDTFTAEGIDFGTALFWGEAALGDYDADGDLDIIVSGYDDDGASLTYIYRNESVTANTIPTTPENLTAEIGETDVVFSWDASTDAETATEALTYNIYIRYDNGNLFYPAMTILETGMKLIPSMGNTNLNTTWTLNNLPTDMEYFWSVQAVDSQYASSEFAVEGNFVLGTPADSDSNEISMSNSILSNYPNPFNPITTIEFSVKNIGLENADLEIFNAKGQLVHKFGNITISIADEVGSVAWDGTDSKGNSVGSGIYFYNLVVDGKTIAGNKMVLLK